MHFLALIGAVLVLGLIGLLQLAALHKVNDSLRDVTELLDQIRQDIRANSAREKSVF